MHIITIKSVFSMVFQEGHACVEIVSDFTIAADGFDNSSFTTERVSLVSILVTKPWSTSFKARWITWTVNRWSNGPIDKLNKFFLSCMDDFGRKIQVNSQKFNDVISKTPIVMHLSECLPYILFSWADFICSIMIPISDIHWIFRVCKHGKCVITRYSYSFGGGLVFGTHVDERFTSTLVFAFVGDIISMHTCQVHLRRPY